MNPCDHRQPPQAGWVLPKQSSPVSSGKSQLLQVLQDGRFARLGGNRDVEFDEVDLSFIRGLSPIQP